MQSYLSMLRGINVSGQKQIRYGKTKLSNNFFEKKLDVLATTRNWKTIHALYEMAKKKSFS